VDLCPVGALGSKDFLYSRRGSLFGRNMKRLPELQHRLQRRGRCEQGHRVTGCGRARTPQAQGWFMCDEGRYGYHYVNAKERLMRRWAARATGKWPTACATAAGPAPRPGRRR